MTKKEFYARFEQMVQKPEGSIRGDERLETFEGWDSMAGLSLIAMADAELNVRLPPQQLITAKTVADLVALLGDRIRD
jgi:acyl carrier protein